MYIYIYMLHTCTYISFLSNAACSNLSSFLELEVQDITEQYEAHRGLPWLKGRLATQFGGIDLVKHKGNDLRSLGKPIRKSTKAWIITLMPQFRKIFQRCSIPRQTIPPRHWQIIGMEDMDRQLLRSCGSSVASRRRWGNGGKTQATTLHLGVFFGFLLEIDWP